MSKNPSGKSIDKPIASSGGKMSALAALVSLKPPIAPH